MKRPPGPETRASGEDLALIGRLLRKDERAFSWLIDQYHSLMVRLAQTMVPTRTTAEEVVRMMAPSGERPPMLLFLHRLGRSTFIPGAP